MTNHKHRVASRSSAYGFSAPISGEDVVRRNERAHGGVTFEERCSCGACRRVNANQGSYERSAWRLAPQGDE